MIGRSFSEIGANSMGTPMNYEAEGRGPRKLALIPTACLSDYGRLVQLSLQAQQNF